MKMNKVAQCCPEPSFVDSPFNLIPFDIKHILLQEQKTMMVFCGYETVHEGTCLITIDAHHDSMRTSLKMVQRAAASSPTKSVDNDFNS